MRSRLKRSCDSLSLERFQKDSAERSESLTVVPLYAKVLMQMEARTKQMRVKTKSNPRSG